MPDLQDLFDLSLLKIQFGAIEDRGHAAQSHFAHLTRLDARSDDAGRRPAGRPQCCCLWRVAVQPEAVDNPCRARDAFSHHDDVESSSTGRGVSDAR